MVPKLLTSSQSEFIDHPIPAFSHADNVVENVKTSTTSDTVSTETQEKDVPARVRLRDAVLMYIDHVLMDDDDDFEKEAHSIMGSTLDATHKSFQEIIASDDQLGTRNNKYLADCADESIIHEVFGKLVLSYGKNDESNFDDDFSVLFEKGVAKKEAIETRNLLLQCTQYMADSDHENASKLLDKIKSRACVDGDGTQRLAHYLTNGLEARMLGAPIEQRKSLTVKVLSDAELMKAFELYLKNLPFVEISYYFVNETIMELAQKANTLHIVHFGIGHGHLWLSLIERLSQRSGGAPKLRITGIDFPQPGFRPYARLKDTGIQLSAYCEEFNVPFEYNCFAMNWETIKLGDLKIRKDEVVVANCMHHSTYLLDDTVLDRSPRDMVLNLIRRINPDIFIHVITNGNYNSPFFKSRFREALFHYLTLFEMFDAIMPRESQERKVFEREVWGEEILNVVASEGSERVERPETYKQWHKRTIRAGFMPVALNANIVNKIRDRVKLCYHKDFSVDEAGNWLLDGWKGKPLFALSCWKPANEDESKSSKINL